MMRASRDRASPDRNAELTKGRLSLRAAALAYALLLCAAAARAQPAEPQGYRDHSYNSPTPATLNGAPALTAQEALALWRIGAAFVDVLPQAPRPANLPDDAIWREKPHSDIPGSIWLADVGYPALSAPMLRYFEAGLAKAVGGDRSRIVVIYCKRDCWMSWNAAKRAQEIGFTQVKWFADGVEGWADLGEPLAPNKPEPR